MKLIAPNYYPAFRCIADKCRHSCCIGWEIDIDPDTREMYRRVPGEFGARLNASIEDGDVSSFRLVEVGQGPTSDSDCLQSPSVASTQPCAEGWPKERCPMLNTNGLCDLITALGEEALCQICADHPRYRNFFADRTEIGLGMCCEEAARLILSQEAPAELITLEDDGGPETLPGEESSLLGLREVLTGILQDRSMPVAARLEAMLNALDSTMPARGRREWAALYRGLERLDPAWDAALDSLDEIAAPPDTLETAFEQFAVYLLYRHLPGALEDDDVVGRAKLVGVSTLMLMLLCGAHTLRHGSCGLADCAEYARMYSAEIEYSEDNIAALLDALWEDA